MLSTRWYIRRLRAMSPREVPWRVKSSLRDVTDRCLLRRRQRLVPLKAILVRDGASHELAFRVSDVPIGQWAGYRKRTVPSEWYYGLLRRAEKLAAHKLSFFDLKDKYLGDKIDWNRDPGSDRPAPMKFSPSIDYRDSSVTGDCKFIWEPNRHHQLVVLGRAYRATGEIRYAQSAVEQLSGWLDQCPFGLGMQWRSPLELGIRLINWVWAVDLIHESGLLAGALRVRLLNAVWRQIWEIVRKYSYGSSANNHLIGEAAGVFIATSYFRDLKAAPKWRTEAKARLLKAILTQTYPDGGAREQALGYHLFIMQLFLISGLVGKWTGNDFPVDYWDRIERMFEFAGILSEGGRKLPMFGDTDDGYVLDLGDDPHDSREWLGAGAVEFKRSDMAEWAGRYHQTARWLLGGNAGKIFAALTPRERDRPITSRSLSVSGYYLLQCGVGRDRISVVFDCGPLGLPPLAGHAHADALSFTLRAFGVDVLVETGTYDYFSYPRWREYFRSTRAHNALVVDGADQSVMLGPFLWGRRARSKCLVWDPSRCGGTVTGEHDGYTRLPDPVVHRRTLTLDGDRGEINVRDEISAAGKHQVGIHFHLGEQCRTEQLRPGRFRIDTGEGIVTIEMDSRLTAETFVGSEDPIAGWVSRAYHCKVPSTSLIGRCTTEGSISLKCRIKIGDFPER